MLIDLEFEPNLEVDSAKSIAVSNQLAVLRFMQIKARGSNLWKVPGIFL